MSSGRDGSTAAGIVFGQDGLRRGGSSKLTPLPAGVRLMPIPPSKLAMLKAARDCGCDRNRFDCARPAVPNFRAGSMRSRLSRRYRQAVAAAPTKFRAAVIGARAASLPL